MSRASARTVRPLRKSRKGNGLTVSARAQATSRDCDVVYGVGLGPAAREPGDPVRAEAIELLACCANDRLVGIPSMSMSAQGRWRRAARVAAKDAFEDMADSLLVELEPHELYAEAEARLREAAR